MKDKLNLIQMANVAVNEAELLHCTLEEAWSGINKSLTDQFDFEEVKEVIMKFTEEYSKSQSE